MLVYIDDSGDGGQKFAQNSSTHLVMAACVFPDYSQMGELAKAVEEVRQETGFMRELKFSGTKNKVKDNFFNKTAPVRFNVRAISIEKRFLYREKLRSDGSALKAYAIHRLLSDNHGQIANAKVFIDGKDTEAFDIPDHAYLMRQVNRKSPGTIREVRFVDSKENVGIQNADMMAGAIHRAVRNDSKRDDRWFWYMKTRLRYPMGTLWDFCKRERQEWDHRQTMSIIETGDPTP